MTMGKNKKYDTHQDHKKPNTRREFLASGMMGSAAFMMAPSILQVLATSVAKADDSCGSASATVLPAFVGVNLAGGMSLSGNYMVHDSGGSLLSNYDILGLGTGVITTEKEFQGVLFPSSNVITTSFLTGLRNTAGTAVAKTSFVGVCVPLQDDTSNNAIDPTGMVTAAGLVGALLPKLGRSSSTGTGISQKASNTPPPAPLIVSKIADLTSALAPASSLTSSLTSAQQKSLLSLVSTLSGSQARAVASVNSSSSQTLSTLVQCATDKNIDLATQTNPGIDPQLDSDKTVSNLWSMTNGGTLIGRTQNERTIFGSMVYNALKGNSGSVGLELGGYDYHGQGANAQNQKDFEAGQLVGQVLATAAAMGKKVFIHVTSDGSVGAPSGSGVRPGFTGDRGSGGMAYMLAFDPAGRPAMKSDKAAPWQLGSFSKGLGAEDNTMVGSADKAGVAAFANYLQFAGQMSLFGKAITPLSISDQDAIVRFA